MAEVQSNDSAPVGAGRHSNAAGYLPGAGAPNIPERYDPGPGEAAYAWSSEHADNLVMGKVITAVVVLGTPVPQPLPGNPEKCSTTCCYCGSVIVYEKKASLVRCHCCTKVTQVQSVGAGSGSSAPTGASNDDLANRGSVLNRWGFNLGFGGSSASHEEPSAARHPPEQPPSGVEVLWDDDVESSLTRCGSCQTTLKIPNVLLYFTCTKCGAVLQNPNGQGSLA